MSKREELAEEFIWISEDLEKAAAHCRTTSERFRGHDVPSVCAHIVACLGHMSKAQKSISACAEVHSELAILNETE